MDTKSKDKLLLQRYAIYYYVVLVPLYIGFWYYASTRLTKALRQTNTNTDDVQSNNNKQATTSDSTRGLSWSTILIVVLVSVLFVLSVFVVLRRRKQMTGRLPSLPPMVTETLERLPPLLSPMIRERLHLRPTRKLTLPSAVSVQAAAKKAANKNTDKYRPPTVEEIAATELTEAISPWQGYGWGTQWIKKIARSRHGANTKRDYAIASLPVDETTASMFKELLKLRSIGTNASVDKLRKVTLAAQKSLVNLEKAQDSFILAKEGVNRNIIDASYTNMVTLGKIHVTNLNNLYNTRNSLAFHMKTNDVVTLARVVPVAPPPKHDMNLLVKSHTPKGTMELYGGHLSALVKNMQSGVQEIHLCAPYMDIENVRRAVLEQVSYGKTMLGYLRNHEDIRIRLEESEKRITDGTMTVAQVLEYQLEKQRDGVEVAIIEEQMAKVQVFALKGQIKLRDARESASVVANIEWDAITSSTSVVTKKAFDITKKTLDVISSIASQAHERLSGLWNAKPNREEELEELRKEELRKEELTKKAGEERQRAKRAEEEKKVLASKLRAAEALVVQAQEERSRVTTAAMEQRIRQFEIYTAKTETEKKERIIAKERAKKHAKQKENERILAEEREKQHAKQKENERVRKSLEEYLDNYRQEVATDDSVQHREADIRAMLKSGERVINRTKRLAKNHVLSVIDLNKEYTPKELEELHDISLRIAARRVIKAIAGELGENPSNDDLKRPATDDVDTPPVYKKALLASKKALSADKKVLSAEIPFLVRRRR